MRVVVVTGASSGIGRATALALARGGDSLVLASRSERALAEVRSECEKAGAAALVVPTHVADRPVVEALFATAVEHFGRVDAVVHAAAVLAYGRFQDIPADAFDRIQEVNILGTANVARAALDVFAEQGSGHLVVLGSVLGKMAAPLMSSYATSKWAVHGLVRTLQIEARRTPGIDVSLVSPGGVNTPIYSLAGNYTGRAGRPPPPVDPPEKVARAILRVLDRPRREVSVGLANPLMVTGFRLLPGVFDRIVTPLLEEAALSRDQVPPNAGNVFTPRDRLEQVHGRWGRHWLRAVAGAGVASGVAAVVAGRMASTHRRSGRRGILR